MGTPEHPQHLRGRASKQFYLSQRPCFLHGLCDIWPDRPQAYLLYRGSVWGFAVLLAGWFYSAVYHLRCREGIPTVQGQVLQRAYIFRRDGPAAARDSPELSLVVAGWVRLPEVHPQPVSRMVDAIQLHYQCRSRRWPDYMYDRHHRRVEPHWDVVP